MRSLDRSTPPGGLAAWQWAGTVRRSACVAALAGLALACGTSPVGSVGAVLALDRSRDALVVREAPPDMTGALGGLRAGDVILSVDGVDVRGLDGKDVASLLRGDIGSEVALTVDRKGEIERLRVVRGPFKPRAKVDPAAGGR